MEDFAGHSREYVRRRFLNWFPMGLTYAFLYMGRYNLTVSKNALGDAMTKEDFGLIFAAGTLTYAFAFLLNGPLTDRIGGRKGILIAAMGSGVANLLMGLYIHFFLVSGQAGSHLVAFFSIIYAINMYFQSFGAVSIVKVNAHWFHVRERGGFGGIFGTMIASGIFFAFTVNGWVLDQVSGGNPAAQFANSMWVFYLPSAILFGMFAVEYFLLRDRPGEAGFEDFDTGDASSGEDGASVPSFVLMKRILTNPIIITVAFIEFCTGVLRNGVMHWYPIYAQEVLSLPSSHYLVHGDWGRWYTIVPPFVLSAVFLVLAAKSKGRRVGWYAISGGLLFIAPFIQGGWGGILMVSGVIGSNVAGWVSDLFFQSRRAPTAAGLYAGLILFTVGMVFVLGGTTNRVAWYQARSAEAAPELNPGDEVLSVNGIAVEDWEDVTRAVACIPLPCKDSQWDAEDCICTGKAKGESEEATAVLKPIMEFKVMRSGVETLVGVPDPFFGKAPRAGDARKLKAGPELLMNEYWMGLIIFFMSLCVIGAHGVLSGTATMDFGGRKGAATAVGMIDGFVYLGTGLQSVALGFLTSRSWTYWPLFLIPFAIIGFLLSLRIWNAKPGKAAH